MKDKFWLKQIGYSIIPFILVGINVGKKYGKAKGVIAGLLSIMLLVGFFNVFTDDNTDTKIVENKVYITVEPTKQAIKTTATSKPTSKPTAKLTTKPPEKLYDASITYDNLARNPDKYKFQGVVFTGEVIQVIESNEDTQFRIAIDGNYDKVMYCIYMPEEGEQRILEKDVIRFNGIFTGIIDYKTVLGAKISVPSIAIAEIIER